MENEYKTLIFRNTLEKLSQLVSPFQKNQDEQNDIKATKKSSQKNLLSSN